MKKNYNSTLENQCNVKLYIILFALLLFPIAFYAQCDQPTAITKTSLTPNSVAFSWSPPITGATSYDYYVTNDLINYPPINAETNSTQTGATSATVTGLTSSFTYKIYVRSRCNLLKSAWSSGGTFTTLAPNSGCANAPYGLYPAATYTPACTGNPEVIVNDAYAGQYTNVNVIANRQYVFTSSVASDYITITNAGLSAVIAHGPSPLVWNSDNFSGSIRYYLNTNSTCGSAEVARSRSITCQVVPSSCLPPITLQTYSITSNSAVLKWAFPGTFTTTQYYVSTSSNTPTINQTPTGSELIQSEVTATNLSPNTTYYYWLRSKCGNDLSNWVAGGSFTTMVSNPVGCIGSLYGQNPQSSIFTPACFGNQEIIATNAWGGDYSSVNIIPNKIYTFTSSVSTDFITITDDRTFFVYASGTTPLVWSSGANTATIRFLLNTSSTCGTQNVSRTKSISCQAGVANCSTPSSLVISAITATTANLNWAAANPTPTNGYQYYYNTANTAPTTGTQPSGTTLTTSVSLSGLAAGTTYYFWVRSNCGANQSSWVFGNNFSTLGAGSGCTTAVFGQYPDNPFTPACFGVNENIVTDAYAGEFSTVNILPNKEYTFVSSVASDYITISNADATVTYIVGNTPLVWLSGSNSGVIRYYFHSNSTCGSQNSNRTRSIICQDAVGPTCNNPSPTATSSITTTSAILNWTAASPTPSNGYQYYYSANSAAPTSGTSPSGNTNNTSVNITSLNTATTYYVWIRSNCGASQSAWVSAGSFITLSGVSCNPPTPLPTTSITTSSAILNWSAPNPAPANGYQAYIDTVNVTPTSNTTPTGSVTTTSGTISGLDINTTYYYWIRSNCGGLQSAWVYGGSFTTTLTNGCTTASQGQFPAANFTPACSGNVELIVTNAYAGEYSNVNIVTNKQYTFSSSVTTDYVTITNSTASVIFAHGPSPLIWNSGTNSGVIRYYFHTDSSCGEELIDRSRFIKCSTVLANVTFDESRLKLFPNPTTHLLNISNDAVIDGVALYNMLGQLVKEQIIHAKDGVIDMSSFSPGTYFVKVFVGDTSKTLKVIKE